MSKVMDEMAQIMASVTDGSAGALADSLEEVEGLLIDGWVINSFIDHYGDSNGGWWP